MSVDQRIDGRNIQGRWKRTIYRGESAIRIHARFYTKFSLRYIDYYIDVG